jgi:hypothetical protein
VVGYKYVRLYHPRESCNLSPMIGRMNNNRYAYIYNACIFMQYVHIIYMYIYTYIYIYAYSEVDLTALGEDKDKFPLSAVESCKYTETVLKPGDMLYIPRYMIGYIAF